MMLCMNYMCKDTSCKQRIKMLECDRIDISEGTDINKTSGIKECDICQFWYLNDIGF